MTKIKICGIRRSLDVEILNKLLPDYAGFVFAKSKRRIDLEEGIKLSRQMDKRIKKVGVFVNEDLNLVQKIAKNCELDIIQLHGDEDESYIKQLQGFEIWKSIRIKDSKDLIRLNQISSIRYLLDTYDKNAYGGTGSQFDWNLLNQIKDKSFVLAGGINIENVVEAIKGVGPYALDISSGVESDGFKDYQKIKSIIERVREYEAN